MRKKLKYGLGYWNYQFLQSCSEVHRFAKDCGSYGKKVVEICQLGETDHLEEELLNWYLNSQPESEVIKYLSQSRKRLELSQFDLDKERGIVENTHWPFVLKFEDGGSLELCSTNFGIFYASENQLAKKNADIPMCVDVNRLFSHLIGSCLTSISCIGYQDEDYEARYLNLKRTPADQVRSLSLHFSNGDELYLFCGGLYALKNKEHNIHTVPLREYLACLDGDTMEKMLNYSLK